MMSIQWFPGHMNAARKEAAKTMEVIDVIVEVLDARVPQASSNPLIEELRLPRQRPCLKVLNKADLANPAVTKAWLERLTSNRVKAVALSCHHAGQARSPVRRRPRIDSTAKRCVLIIIPNVGKRR